MKYSKFDLADPNLNSERRCIVTVAHGSSAKEQLDIVLPSWLTYAKWHGWDVLIEGDGELEKNEAKARKFTIIQEALKQGYDNVLWLDVDVIIKDATQCIRGVIPQWASYAARLESNFGNSGGANHNTGVWFFKNNKQTKDLFKALESVVIDHPYVWYDQARLMTVFGYEISPFRYGIRQVHYSPHLAHHFSFPKEWNVIFREEASSNVRFRHITGGYDDRLGQLRSIADSLVRRGEIIPEFLPERINLEDNLINLSI